MIDSGRAHRWLAAAAAVLGALAPAAGEPSSAASAREREPAYVTAVDLARAIRDRKDGLRLLDLRPHSEFTRLHVPGAEHVALDDVRRRAWRRGETVVVYAADESGAAHAVRLLRARGVDSAYALLGGLRAWIDHIAEPRLTPLPAAAAPDEQAARREQLALSRYFGGTPVVLPAGALPSRRSEPAAVARILRRGC